MIDDDSPMWESNSSKPIIQYKKALKERQRSGFGRVAPQAKTIPTCENEAEILLLFSVPIIILTKYIIIIYWDCTWFPHPMVEHKFHTKNNVVLCALSLLLDSFEKEHQLFAEQCIS